MFFFDGRFCILDAIMCEISLEAVSCTLEVIYNSSNLNSHNIMRCIIFQHLIIN